LPISFTWGQSAGGTEWDNNFRTVVDSDGNIYTLGFTYSPIFNYVTDNSVNDDISSNTGSSVYLIKYDPSGNLVWKKIYNANCTGREVAKTCEECWGRCGPKCECWDWGCGDCCCHKGCLDHDEWCSCFGTAVCIISVPLAPLNCAPCDVPNGELPCSTPGCPTGCPNDKFWCKHTKSCLTKGSICQPKCSPTQQYCERLQRCVTKGQCKKIEECATSRNCSADSFCYRGRCVAY
jgi:hypothetical protein